MTNPFDDESGRFLVLRNDEGQHSLWPTSIDVPAGWAVAHDEADRETCVRYVEENWRDLRPASLINSTEASAS